MRGPPVHVADQRTEGNIVHEVFHVLIRVLRRRTVIKHEDHAGHRQDNEQEKGYPSHPPRIPDVGSVARDPHRMEMKENVVDDLEGTVPVRVLIVVAEDRLPDFRLLQLFPYF